MDTIITPSLLAHLTPCITGPGREFQGLRWAGPSPNLSPIAHPIAAAEAAQETVESLMQKFKESFRANTPIEIGQLRSAPHSISGGKRKRRSKSRGRSSQHLILGSQWALPRVWRVLEKLSSFLFHPCVYQSLVVSKSSQISLAHLGVQITSLNSAAPADLGNGSFINESSWKHEYQTIEFLAQGPDAAEILSIVLIGKNLKLLQNGCFLFCKMQEIYKAVMNELLLCMGSQQRV